MVGFRFREVSGRNKHSHVTQTAQPGQTGQTGHGFLGSQGFQVFQGSQGSHGAQTNYSSSLNYSAQAEEFRNSISPLTTNQSSRASSPVTAAASADTNLSDTVDEDLLPLGQCVLGISSCKPVDELAYLRTPFINKLPDEILSLVVDALGSSEDVKSFMLTQKRWLPLGLARLWYKVMPTSRHQLAVLCETLFNNLQDTQDNLENIENIDNIDNIDEIENINDINEIDPPGKYQRVISRSPPTLQEILAKFKDNCKNTGTPLVEYRHLIRRINLAHVAEVVAPSDLRAFADLKRQVAGRV